MPIRSLLMLLLLLLLLLQLILLLLWMILNRFDKLIRRLHKSCKAAAQRSQAKSGTRQEHTYSEVKNLSTCMDSRRVTGIITSFNAGMPMSASSASLVPATSADD
jgi:hypothetical protein